MPTRTKPGAVAARTALSELTSSSAPTAKSKWSGSAASQNCPPSRRSACRPWNRSIQTPSSQSLPIGATTGALTSRAPWRGRPRAVEDRDLTPRRRDRLDRARSSVRASRRAAGRASASARSAGPCRAGSGNPRARSPCPTRRRGRSRGRRGSGREGRAALVALRRGSGRRCWRRSRSACRSARAGRNSQARTASIAGSTKPCCSSATTRRSCDWPFASMRPMRSDVALALPSCWRLVGIDGLAASSATAPRPRVWRDGGAAARGRSRGAEPRGAERMASSRRRRLRARGGRGTRSARAGPTRRAEAHRLALARAAARIPRACSSARPAGAARAAAGTGRSWRCRSRRRAGRAERRERARPRSRRGPTMRPDFVFMRGAGRGGAARRRARGARATARSARRDARGGRGAATVSMLWFRISGASSSTRLERVAVALEVGDQDLDGAAGHAPADRADRRREMRGAAVGQVVAVDRGHDGVREAELRARPRPRARAPPGRARPGVPLPTAQKPQWRVQMSPISMKVAVRSRAQHSWMFGQRASSQTVTSERRRIIARTSSYSPVVLSADLQPLGPLEAERRSAGAASGQLRASRGGLSPGRRPRRNARQDRAATSSSGEARGRVRRSIVVTPPSVMPHGTMPAKYGERLVRDVQREAVRRDPARDVDADRGDLVVADPDAT